MFIPRANSHNCLLDDPNCLPVMAIVDTNPSEEDPSDSTPTPTPGPDYSKPGPHRYIGVAMVAGLVLIVALWVLVTKSERARRIVCCGRKRAIKERADKQESSSLRSGGKKRSEETSNSSQGKHPSLSRHTGSVGMIQIAPLDVEGRHVRRGTS